jgi:hypothetical protein
MFELNKRIPLSELVDPKHTALLLWDMENAIILKEMINLNLTRREHR